MGEAQIERRKMVTLPQEDFEEILERAAGCDAVALGPGLGRGDGVTELVLDLLRQEKVLVVQGSGFNYPGTDHFRVVFLPNVDDLHEALGRLGRFLDGYRRRGGKPAASLAG